MNSTIGVAVVGMGAIGQEHAAIYPDIPGSELVPLVDPDLDPATLAAQWGDDVTVYPSLQTAMEDPRVDAVSLCTPDHLHYDDAMRVLQGGRNLLLEKPIAVDPREARQLVTTAEASDVVVMPGHTLRFEPRYAFASNVVKDGGIGDIVHGYVRRNNKQSVAARAAGRVSVSHFLGIHDVDALQWIAGRRVEWVNAAETTVRDASGKRAAAVMATLGLAGGSLVQLEAAWALPETYPTDLDARFRLVGTSGELSIDAFDSGLHIASEFYSLPMAGGAPLYGRSQGPLREELAHFIECCSHGTEPAVTMREAGQAVMVMDAIERAIVSGRRESVAAM